MINNLTIIYEMGESGWWIASIPEIPGAFSQGKTRDSAKKNVIDAANELMLARRKAALKGHPKNADVENLRLFA